jgi:hypothetical protein
MIQIPTAYIFESGMRDDKLPEIVSVREFDVNKEHYQAIEYKNTSNSPRLAVFLKTGSHWSLVQDLVLTTDIQNHIYAIVVDVDSRGIHCAAYRDAEDHLVDSDWILVVSPDTVLPEHTTAAKNKFTEGKKLSAEEAILLSAPLWWIFRDDPLLDLALCPVEGVTITSSGNFFRVQDPSGNEVGAIDVQARLFPAANGDQYLLVSAEFESGSEWWEAREYLIRFSRGRVTLLDNAWQQGLGVRSFLRNPDQGFEQEGLEADDLWFRLSESGESVWAGCRYDPAFGEVTAVNPVTYLEDLKYKAIELVWNPEKATFEVGQKIAR